MRTLQMRNLQTRESDDGTLTIEGIAAPYGETIEYGGMSESFERDAFDAGAVPGRPLLWSHERNETVGHITSAENTERGLQIEAVVQPTQRGRDAILLLRAGSLKGLSVGFEPLERRDTDGGQVFTKARLHELSLTPMPAYESAQITATRDKEPAVADTETREAPVDLSPITDRIDQLEARMVAPAPRPARTLQMREALALQIADAQEHGGHLRALADVLSSGNAGILPPQWSSEVRNAFDGSRYLIPRLGSVAFPSTGYTLTVPKVLQNTTVAARGTEKTEVPTRALTTGSDTFTAKWFAGAVDIALELVSQSDPSIVALVVQNLVEQYAAATDAQATTDLNTAATATGAALDFTSYKTFVAGIFTTSEAIRSATGEPGNLLQLKPASWASLIGLVDADGRRILATNGATNADGSANLVAQSVDVGGILCFLNPRTTTDVQFNAKSARIAEKPPLQVTQDVVALMGRDIGILGATMFIPMFTTGIKRHATTELASADAKKK